MMVHLYKGSIKSKRRTLQDERVVGGLVVGHGVATACSAAAKVATGEAEPEVRGRAALIARTDPCTARYARTSRRRTKTKTKRKRKKE